MYKKIMIGTILVAMMVSLVGCGNVADNKQTDQQLQTSGKLPPNHPDLSSSQETADPTKIESTINDMLNEKFPGDWQVSDSTLSKGNYTENNNYKIVDEISNLFPGNMGVSIFVGQERISTSILEGGIKRALDYQGTGMETVEATYSSGKTTTSEISGYLKLYIPFKSGDKTLAVMTISIPQ